MSLIIAAQTQRPAAEFQSRMFEKYAVDGLYLDDNLAYANCELWKEHGHPTRAFYNEVWSSADGVQWQLNAVAPWPPRQYHSVAVFDNKMWVMAGGNNSTPGYNRNDVWYSSDGVNWIELPNTVQFTLQPQKDCPNRCFLVSVRNIRDNRTRTMHFLRLGIGQQDLGALPK